MVGSPRPAAGAAPAPRHPDRDAPPPRARRRLGRRPRVLVAVLRPSWSTARLPELGRGGLLGAARAASALAACWWGYRRFRLDEPERRPRVPPHRSGRSGRAAMTRRPGADVLIVVRHGRTEANASGLLLGRLDPGLDELGRRQAGRPALAGGRRHAGRVQPAPAHPRDGGGPRPPGHGRRALDRARLRRVRRHAAPGRATATSGRSWTTDPDFVARGRRVDRRAGRAGAGRLRGPRRGEPPSATSSWSPMCRR